jgi:hypothetical protein
LVAESVSYLRRKANKLITENGELTRIKIKIKIIKIK